MEDKASEEELGKNQESNTETCGKEIKICGKSGGKQKNQNKTKRAMNK